jgi:hypothetical protein
MRVYHHIDKELFDKRDNELWPRWDRPETIIVSEINPFASKSAVRPIQIVPPPPTANDSLRDRLRKRAHETR